VVHEVSDEHVEVLGVAEERKEIDEGDARDGLHHRGREREFG
jgi:hypothetical protein